MYSPEMMADRVRELRESGRRAQGTSQDRALLRDRVRDLVHTHLGR
jgi:hypothetical protein